MAPIGVFEWAIFMYASHQEPHDPLESRHDVVEAQVVHHGEHVHVHVDEVCGCVVPPHVEERVVHCSRLEDGSAPWREAQRHAIRRAFDLADQTAEPPAVMLAAHAKPLDYQLHELRVCPPSPCFELAAFPPFHRGDHRPQLLW